MNPCVLQAGVACPSCMPLQEGERAASDTQFCRRHTHAPRLGKKIGMLGMGSRSPFSRFALFTDKAETLSQQCL